MPRTKSNGRVNRISLHRLALGIGCSVVAWGLTGGAPEAAANGSAASLSSGIAGQNTLAATRSLSRAIGNQTAYRLRSQDHPVASEHRDGAAALTDGAAGAAGAAQLEPSPAGEATSDGPGRDAEKFRGH